MVDLITRIGITLKDRFCSGEVLPAPSKFSSAVYTAYQLVGRLYCKQ